jgi:hypothetical protein
MPLTNLALLGQKSLVKTPLAGDLRPFLRPYLRRDRTPSAPDPTTINTNLKIVRLAHPGSRSPQWSLWYHAGSLVLEAQVGYNQG